MTKLLWENLKIFKLSYLYTFIMVSVSISCAFFFDFLRYPLYSLSLMMIIGLPEFIRLQEILNSGYFRLLNKLPISSNDIYRHKFIVSISGTVLLFTLVLVINFFAILPTKFFEFLNILSSNIFVGIIIHDSTKLYNLPKKLSQPNSTILAMASYMILLIFYFSFFGLITSKEYLFWGPGLISINYLIYLVIQIVSAYYFGKLYYFVLKRTRIYKKYGTNEIN